MLTNFDMGMRTHFGKDGKVQYRKKDPLFRTCDLFT